MTFKFALHICACLAAGTCFELFQAVAVAQPDARHRLACQRERPNIVLFLVDDMGWQDTSVPFHTAVKSMGGVS